MGKYTLKTAFKKTFSGIIWRIEVGMPTGILAIETRDQDTGNPSFSTIEYTTGQSGITEKQYGDRNWSLAGVIDSLLILRAWVQNTPEGAGIACIDATTGDLLWEQFNYTLVAVTDRQIVVRHRNFVGGYEQFLNPYDGNLSSKDNLANHLMRPEIVLPTPYTDPPPSFLDHYNIAGDLFSCLIDDRTVWAFHEAIENTYQIRLIVSHGLNVLTDNLAITGLPKMTPELFFAIRNQLFLIGNNKREIISYLV